MKLHILAAVSALGFLALPGCAIAGGDASQDITVVTDPPGASCVLEREDQQISTIANTPGIANVSKSENEITIKCDKPGFQQAQHLDQPRLKGSAGIAYFIIGFSSNSDYDYDSPVNITLTPLDTSPTTTNNATSPTSASPTTPAASPTTPASSPTATDNAAAPAAVSPTPSPNVTQLASLPPQSPPPSANPFDGQWLISGKGAFGISIGSFPWKIAVVGNKVLVTGAFGDLTYKEGHVDGDRITLLWTGTFDDTIEGKLVSSNRMEGRCHNFLTSVDWWADKQ